VTTFTMRRIGGEFVVTSPDIEPMKFKTRREAKRVLLPGGRRAKPASVVRTNPNLARQFQSGLDSRRLRGNPSAWSCRQFQPPGWQRYRREPIND
jgi:hypothetical protein